MLNARLYRTSWLVAGVALVVALLTLQRPATPPQPALPPAFDGAGARALAGNLALATPRPPGSAADERAADWVEGRLRAIPGGAGRVGRQSYVAHAGGVSYRLSNVYLAVPASPPTSVEEAILVVAPRDTPPGARGGATGTAMLLELARSSVANAHRRPLLFVSTDGATLGNAGIRWFLNRFSAVPIAGAVVLDEPDSSGAAIRAWDDGRGGGQAVALATYAREAIRRAGGRPRGEAGFFSQLLGLAVPQTFGDQGPMIADRVPAVTLSGRRESPLPARSPEPTEERLTLAGNAVQGLIGALDRPDLADAPEASVTLAGRVLRPGIVRIALLLLALPVLVVAVDAFARGRRARVGIGRGLRAVGWRIVPALAALAAAHLLVLFGLLPEPAAGAPPLPAAVPFDAASAAGALIAVAVGVLAAWVGRRRVRLLWAEPPAEAVAALALLAVLLVVLWWTRPFALVLALPAAHAALVATAAPRRWQVAALAFVAVVPLLALCAEVGRTLDRGPIFAAWYLLETAASGARGAWGPIAFCAVAGTIWALGALVAFRARKGLVVAAGPSPAEDRPVRPSRSG
jgi:hypothetical protein